MRVITQCFEPIDVDVGEHANDSGGCVAVTTELAGDAERERLTREEISKEAVLLREAARSGQLLAADLRVLNRGRRHEIRASRLDALPLPFLSKATIDG